MLPLALHIPDGFFPRDFALGGWLLAVPALAWCLRHWATHQEGDDPLPLAGLLAAWTFAAQTLQFPVPGGTSSHLIGSALACLLLGSAGGLTVIASVVLLQALLFSVGGVLSFGWNLVNMGMLGGWLALPFFRLLRQARCSTSLSAFVATWLAVQCASLATCLELAAAGTSPLSLSLPAMALGQGLVGIGEAAVVVAALNFLARVRPGLARATEQHGGGPGWVALGLLAGASLLPPRCYGVQAPWSAAALLALLLTASPLLLWGRWRHR